MPGARRLASSRPGRLLAAIAIVAAIVPSAGAQIVPSAGAQDEGRERRGFEALPGIDRALFSGIEWRDDEVILADAEILAGDAQVLADEIRYDLESETVVATGSVVLAFPGAVLTGSSLSYDVRSETGEIQEAVGYLEQDGAILRAERIARVGPKRLKVVDAVFTTCTQPVPYWSFRIARGTFDLGQYAYLTGVAFKASRVPLFYTPYLTWPIKTDRAAGLLFPEFSSSDKLGETISVPLYWPFASNAEVTLLMEYHSKVGTGLGAMLEWLPTWRGVARGDMRWINDEVRGEDRWSFEWEQKQDLPADFRLTSTLEFVSDFDYLTDYETDLRRAGSPFTRSRIDLTRNWSWYSFSARAIRDEQFFVGGAGLTRFLTGQVVNTQLPELELRGRSQRLGRSPFFLSFESSVAGFRKEILEPPPGQLTAGSEDELVTRARNDWLRADLAPALQVPVIRLPWLDVQIGAGWRGTWYSARPDLLDSQQVVTDPVFRSLWNAGLSISGPRFQRVFETPGWGYSPRIKHVIEPFVTYQWRPEAGADPGEIIVFDELDGIPGRLSDVTYGLRQRLFVLRAPSTGRATSLAAAKEISFRGLERLEEQNTRREQTELSEPALADSRSVGENLNPAEYLSFELFQRYSFVRPLSTVYGVLTDPETGQDLLDPVTGRPRTIEIDERNASPVTARLRFNPTLQNSVDVTYEYDPANKKLTESSISAMLRDPGRAYLRASWFRRQPGDPAASETSSFLRSSWGVSAGSKLRFESSLDFDLEASELDHQAYKLTYATQCCSFELGYDRRDFVDNSRRELLLVVDLTGIGEVLRLSDSQSD